MSQSITLPAITRSPATLQYRVLATRPPKFYKPRFVLAPEDRAKTLGAEWLKKTDPLMPEYPYGIDVRYPEANQGLYGGMSIQSGSKISKGRNKGKTLRKWYPNVKLERIKSEALGKELTIPIAARVMRTIKKVGGLDQYLTGEKPARVKELGLLGWKLRWLVINSELWKLQYRKKQEALGIPRSAAGQNVLNETFQQAWADEQKREELIRQQNEKWEKMQEKDERFKRHFARNIVSDKSNLKIPELSSLSLYDPESLGLRDAEFKEVEQTRANHPSSDMRY